jgi:hypothetical protein
MPRVNVTVSLPDTLAEQMRAAGLRPSQLLASAVKERLGGKGKPGLDQRVRRLEIARDALSKRLAALEGGQR